MSEEFNICEVCKGQCKKPYTVCFNCKQKKEVSKTDKYQEGMKTGLAHNLAIQATLNMSDVLFRNGEDIVVKLLKEKKVYIKEQYMGWFKFFKEKIKEGENGTDKS